MVSITLPRARIFPKSVVRGSISLFPTLARRMVGETEAASDCVLSVGVANVGLLREVGSKASVYAYLCLSRWGCLAQSSTATLARR